MTHTTQALCHVLLYFCPVPAPFTTMFLLYNRGIITKPSSVKTPLNTLTFHFREYFRKHAKLCFWPHCFHWAFPLPCFPVLAILRLTSLILTCKKTHFFRIEGKGERGVWTWSGDIEIRFTFLNLLYSYLSLVATMPNCSVAWKPWCIHTKHTFFSFRQHRLSCRRRTTLQAGILCQSWSDIDVTVNKTR